MFFFALYMTFDSLYRYTSFILIIFVSNFIITSYYYSLYYPIITTDKFINVKCEWFGMWTPNSKPDWNEKSSIYFRYSPYFYQWILLIVMKLLTTINTLFKDKGLTKKLESICYEKTRERYNNVIFNYNIIKNFLRNFMIYIYIIIMMFFLKEAQINLISYILVIQNTILIATVSKMSNSDLNLNL